MHIKTTAIADMLAYSTADINGHKQHFSGYEKLRRIAKL
jgi:hypothetical protein